MTIKPWLSKNFLQMMQWSNVRDYPPKRKKPWLFDNFMEMEEIHSDHMEETFKLPNDPLPPPPDIPQDPEDVEPDPCEGDRSLWVLVSPSSTVDCAVDTGFTLVISPDFKCKEITRAFPNEDGPQIVDENGNDFSTPTNANDIIGGLKLEKGCEETPYINLWVCDCLCGGCSTVTIWLDNCSVDCDAVELTGPTSVSSSGSYQYSYTNFPEEVGQVQWSVAGTGASIGQDGMLYTSGACGMLRVIANSNCCGVRSMYVKVTDSGVWDRILEEYAYPACTPGSPPYCVCGIYDYLITCYIDEFRYAEYSVCKDLKPTECWPWSPSISRHCSAPGCGVSAVVQKYTDKWICAP